MIFVSAELLSEMIFVHADLLSVYVKLISAYALWQLHGP